MLQSISLIFKSTIINKWLGLELYTIFNIIMGTFFLGVVGWSEGAG